VHTGLFAEISSEGSGLRRRSEILFSAGTKRRLCSGFGYKVPTPETEKMFEDSFDAAVNEDVRIAAKLPERAQASGHMRSLNPRTDRVVFAAYQYK
jgi:hypothetical protein